MFNNFKNSPSFEWTASATSLFWTIAIFSLFWLFKSLPGTVTPPFYVLLSWTITTPLFRISLTFSVSLFISGTLSRTFSILVFRLVFLFSAPRTTSLLMITRFWPGSASLSENSIDFSKILIKWDFQTTHFDLRVPLSRSFFPFSMGDNFPLTNWSYQHSNTFNVFYLIFFIKNWFFWLLNRRSM